MLPTRTRWAACAGLVTVGWLASPGAVPVYDGVGQPDEPYRYVQPPAGSTTAAPARGTSGSAAVEGERTGGLSLTTGETGPQIALYLPAGALAAPAGPVRVTVTPQAPTAPPKGGTVAGNVYAVAVSSPGGAVSVPKGAAPGSLYLRAPSARQPGPSCVRRASAGAGWQVLKTLRVGNDVYTCTFAGPGQYALAFLSAAGSSGGGPPVLPIVLVAGVVVLGGALLAIRLRSGSG